MQTIAFTFQKILPYLIDSPLSLASPSYGKINTQKIILTYTFRINMAGQAQIIGLLVQQIMRRMNRQSRYTKNNQNLIIFPKVD